MRAWMFPLTWLRRLQQAAATFAAIGVAGWRDVAHLQRTRTLWRQVEDLHDAEYHLRQDLKGLALVKCLHDSAEVRERAKRREAEVERELHQLVSRRSALQRAAGQDYTAADSTR